MRLLHTPPLVLLALATPNDFPGWLRASHWINAFFIGYLIRSGIQILGSYPRLYWNDHCRPGHEWLTLTRHRIPTGRTWTSLEQELDVPLSFEHGAPLRLRCETVLGYKMVKQLTRIELVADFQAIRAGQGGSREDQGYYEPEASI